MPPTSYFTGSKKRFSLEGSTENLIKAVDECKKSTVTAIRPQSAHYKIITAIRSGIDKTMGNDTSNIVLTVMNLVYHLDEETITRQPKLFVDSLVKLLGENVAPVILTAILGEMKN